MKSLCKQTVFTVREEIADAATAQLWMFGMTTDIFSVMPTTPTFFVLTASY